MVKSFGIGITRKYNEREKMAEIERTLLQTFLDNFSKIKFVENKENKSKTYSIVVFHDGPIKNDDGTLDFCGYQIELDVNIDRAKFVIEEVNFGLKGQLRWDYTAEPIEYLVNKMVHMELFEEIVNFEAKYAVWLDEKEDERKRAIGELLENKQYTTTDPVISYMKEKEELKKVSASFQDEPEIMNFGDRDD